MIIYLGDRLNAALGKSASKLDMTVSIIVLGEGVCILLVMVTIHTEMGSLFTVVNPLTVNTFDKQSVKAL